jgi:N-acetylmuramoyl-L-alanine amidase
VIGETGRIVQCVPLDKAAWHAGESFWKPTGGPGRFLGLKGLNRFSFGIELVNAGPLRRTHGGSLYTWWGKPVPPNDIVEVDPTEPGSFNRRYWTRFPEVQIEAAISLVQTLVNTFPMEEILGHSDIAQGRKQDPGPAFPMSHIRALVKGRRVA